MATFIELNLNDGLYLGEVAEDMPHGEGTMKYTNGDMFVGECQVVLQFIVMFIV